MNVNSHICEAIRPLCVYYGGGGDAKVEIITEVPRSDFSR